ncbi:TIR domain-containing protein [Lentzea sp. BCCO 10_0856]|uniref:TIR domain-containing protein n=1 Tax=Lentzea miocenica TaxID=3095431 RepID=A0ABU4SS07_9PSEU|nr:TIR domain-containing protein [Lentzea sp. BCCO 10_0856]MDX8028671.1 TIR domain-containing protein [Lentzea sp. BCCO 10_0856]
MFISYSRKHRTYVRRLADHLVQVAGVEVWFDYELVTGERWDNVVRQKIDDCAALIVVMTPDAENSHWVAEEVARARDQGKLLLPLLLKGSPIFGFMTVHHEDVRDRSMPGDRFVADLRKAAALEPRPPVEPPPRRRTRWLPALLLALAVTAAFPLGNMVWSLVDNPQSTDKQTSAGSSTTTAPSTTTTITTSSTATSSPTSDAAKVVVRIYNNATVAGLAGRAGDDARKFGWTVAETGNYTSGIIPTSTVYFGPRPEEEASAKELASLLRARAEPRFDAIRSAAPGLILIVTNDYQGPTTNS